MRHQSCVTSHAKTHPLWVVPTSITERLQLTIMREVAAITGGAAGLGKGYVRQFTSDGYDVIFCDVDETLGKEVAEEFNATFVKVDVTQPSEVEAFFDRVKSDFGRLDVLINNAGVVRGGVPTHQFPVEDFQFVTSVNTNGAFYVAKYGVKLIVDCGNGGRIVNMASCCSSGATIGARNGLTAYKMSKHAVVGLTQTMALEYAKYGIRVNAVAPARVETEMVARWTVEAKLTDEEIAVLAADNPLEVAFGRMIQVEDVAGIVAFLCSDKAKWINGAVIPVDGGYHCS